MARNAMRVDAAELDKRIEIYRTVTQRKPSGHIAGTTPELVCKRWASFRRNSVKEINAQSGDYKDERVRFLIRGRGKGIDRQMQVKYAGNIYEIEYLNDYNDGGQYTEIGAKLLTLGG